MIPKILPLVASLLLLVAMPALAVESVDWLKVAPEGKTLKLENAHVRVVEVTLKPGQKDPEHTHPANLAYLLSPGKVRVTYTGQKPVELEGKQGEVLYSDPEGPHTVENIGKKALKLLVVELKDLPLTDAPARK
jgi:beta-alanine degradation protein BauB